MLKPFHKLFFKLIQLCNNLKTGCQIFLIGKFCSNRFAFLIRFNRTVIYSSYNIIKEDSCFTKIPYKRYHDPTSSDQNLYEFQVYASFVQSLFRYHRIFQQATLQ